MAHGGRRVGAGRPAGSLAKRTREVAEKAAAEGKTPLEIMLDNMRHFQQVALDAEAILAGLTYDEFTGKSGSNLKPEDQFKLLLAEVKKAAGFRQMAHTCATDAAPYMHPRLQAIEHSGPDGKPIEMEITDSQRVKALALFIARNRVTDPPA